MLERVTKTADLYGGRKNILLEVTAIIPADKRVAVFTESSEERNVFVSLLSGLMLPTAGRISRKSRVSIPTGHLAGFEADLSVRHNIAHIARMYGANPAEVLRFVERVSSFDEQFDCALRDLSPIKRRKLSHILTYALPFDIYVLGDEPTRGPIEIRELTYSLFKVRARSSGMIVPVRSLRFAVEHCDMAIILANGRLQILETMDRMANAL